MVALTRQAMGFAGGEFWLGVGILGGAAAFSATADDKTKQVYANRLAACQRWVGVSPKHLSDRELREMTWKTGNSFTNMMVPAPIFYGLFDYFQNKKAGISVRDRMLRAMGRGVSGVPKSAPTLAALYTAAAVLGPVAQEYFMRAGNDKKRAETLSQAALFVVAGSVPEFFAEAQGCNIKRFQFGPAALGSAAIVARIFFGVATMHNEQGQENFSGVFGKAVCGTVFAQHTINACMQSMAGKQGLMGAFQYYLKGSALPGQGSFKMGWEKFAGTFVQRFGYVLPWTVLSQRSQELPSWVTGDVS